MFDMFPQQNTCDKIKSYAFTSSPAHREAVLESIKRLENAPIWNPLMLAQAIDDVQPGCIQFGERRATIDGGAETLKAVVDRYFELTGQQETETVL